MIYILEDDDSIRKLLAYTLNSHGLDCQGFSLPSEFWRAMAVQKADLVILDIMLPEEDGMSILKKLRENKESSDVPIIMLTARDSEIDIVQGLDAGADDYVTKPFGTMALLSRIKAVLRRYEKKKSAVSGKVLAAANIKIDIDRHTVFVSGKQVFLTVKEFDLLALLVENQGNVLSREQLLDSIWKIDADIESRTVDVHVRTLRQKIGDENGAIVQTVRGVGYKVN